MRGRLVGWMVAFALTVVVIFPVHLVPTQTRYAELGMLLVITLVTLLARGARKLGGWLPMLFLAYLAITYVSTEAAGIEGASFQFLMHAVTGIAFLVLGVSANERERRTISKTVITLGAGEAVYALYEYVAAPTVLWASPVPEKWAWMYTRLANEILTGGLRSQGTFGHPLLLSFVLIVAMGLAIRFPFRNHVARPVLVVLFFAASIAAGSRSAALIMLAMVLFSYGMSRFAFLRGVGLSAILLLLAFTGSFFASDIVGRFTESGSLTHRQGALDAVPRLLSEQSELEVLIGNGWYSTQAVYDKGLLQLDGFVAIDNQFVALLVTTGVVGVVIFALIPLLAYARAGKALRPVVAGAVAVFAVFDIFEFPATWGLFALLIGLAATSVKDAPEPPKQEAAPQFKKRQLPAWASTEQGRKLAAHSAAR